MKKTLGILMVFATIQPALANSLNTRLATGSLLNQSRSSHSTSRDGTSTGEVTVSMQEQDEMSLFSAEEQINILADLVEDIGHTDYSYHYAQIRVDHSSTRLAFRKFLKFIQDNEIVLEQEQIEDFNTTLVAAFEEGILNAERVAEFMIIENNKKQIITSILENVQRVLNISTYEYDTYSERRSESEVENERSRNIQEIVSLQKSIDVLRLRQILPHETIEIIVNKTNKHLRRIRHKRLIGTDGNMATRFFEKNYREVDIEYDDYQIQ